MQACETEGFLTVAFVTRLYIGWTDMHLDNMIDVEGSLAAAGGPKGMNNGMGIMEK